MKIYVDGKALMDLVQASSRRRREEHLEARQKWLIEMDGFMQEMRGRIALGDAKFDKAQLEIILARSPIDPSDIYEEFSLELETRWKGSEVWIS